jgi:protein-tyrosine phosphatase
MIDLHCHMLPGIDDGAPNREVALAMARCAAGDGISVVACTPHIYPGLYDNNRTRIEEAVEAFRQVLAEEGIALELTTGADTHLEPELLKGIRAGRIPTLGGSRYLLLEPPHHSVPPRFEESVFNLRTAGIVPVITHPERLSWIESHYEVFTRIVHSGSAWMQVTAGSLTGRFGSRPQYWGERMLDEGLVHILATDSHHIDRRPPLLAEGREAAAKRVGEEESWHLVKTRPQAILADASSESVPPLPERQPKRRSRQPLWKRLIGNA